MGIYHHHWVLSIKDKGILDLIDKLSGWFLQYRHSRILQLLGIIRTQELGTPIHQPLLISRYGITRDGVEEGLSGWWFG